MSTPAQFVARVSGRSQQLYDAAKAGRIPSVRLGGPDGPLRFIEQDLDEWLERARQAWRPGDSSVRTLRRAMPG